MLSYIISPLIHLLYDVDKPFRSGCITRLLRALEVYAMSPSNLTPPPAVKHILKRLNQGTILLVYVLYFLNTTESCVQVANDEIND